MCDIEEVKNGSSCNTNDKTIFTQIGTTSAGIILENCKYYDMTHKKRGICLILNHTEFNAPDLEDRPGSNIDRDAAITVFNELRFEILCNDNLTKRELLKRLNEVSQMDHSESDCLVVCVMSHGGKKDDIFAKDDKYFKNELLKPFFGNNCKTLVGKPKLFFIQACRGKKLDKGCMEKQTNVGGIDVVDHIDKKDKPLLISIPTMADVLVMHSTYEGYKAWLNPDNGSWFIQSLCRELKENGKTQDIFALLTGVSRRVAYEYKSNVPNDEQRDSMKQMPCIISTLTKLLYFTKKLD